MDKKIIFLRLTFYISLILLAIFSLFPGSLLGFLVFGDFTRQPSLADNPIHIFIDTPNYQMGTIINHFYSGTIDKLRRCFVHLFQGF